MSEKLHYNGYCGEAVEVLSSIPRDNLRGGRVRDVVIPGNRPDLGEVIPKGWSGKPETKFTVINISSSSNMPPLWKKVFWEQDIGDTHQVFVMGHVQSGRHIRGVRGEETVFEMPIIHPAA